MKKAALFSLLIACNLCIVGVPEASTPLNVEPLAAEITFPLELDFGMFPSIPHCGDLCDNPGQSRGCIDTSGSHAVKTFCTCTGGSWTC